MAVMLTATLFHSKVCRFRVLTCIYLTVNWLGNAILALVLMNWPLCWGGRSHPPPGWTHGAGCETSPLLLCWCVLAGSAVKASCNPLAFQHCKPASLQFTNYFWNVATLKWLHWIDSIESVNSVSLQWEPWNSNCLIVGMAATQSNSVFIIYKFFHQTQASTYRNVMTCNAQLKENTPQIFKTMNLVVLFVNVYLSQSSTLTTFHPTLLVSNGSTLLLNN